MTHILSNKEKEEVSKGLEVKLVCFAIMYVGLFFFFFFHFLLKLICRPTYYDRACHSTSEWPDFYLRSHRVTKYKYIINLKHFPVYTGRIWRLNSQDFTLNTSAAKFQSYRHEHFRKATLIITLKMWLSAYLDVLYSWWDLLLLLRSHLEDVDSIGGMPETPEDRLSCGVGRLFLLLNPCWVI